MMVSPCFWQIFPTGCSMIFDCPVDRSWCAQRCCDRSCDGVAAAMKSLLRRRCADQLRRAHSARRVRDGADAAATELMLRAALLRRSCDGVAALLRRSRCCDGDAQISSVALILRVASRRDALNEEPASFPPVIQISMVVAHSPRPSHWPRN